MSQWYEPIFQKDDLPHPDAKTTGKASEQQPVLYRYVDGAWENVIGPHADVQGGFGFGIDGVLRVDTADGRHLFFEDDEWHEWQTPTWQPAWEEGWPSWHVAADRGYPHAPDGSLWATWMLPPPEDCAMVCLDRIDGVVRYDGDAFQHFLPGHQLQLWGFTPDGAAWFTGGDAEWALRDGITEDDWFSHTYVIIPDAASPVA
jgi:hypothetical protein